MVALHDLRLESRRFVRFPLHRPNGANGMSDMAGNAARVAVERGGSCRDTMERMG